MERPKILYTLPDKLSSLLKSRSVDPTAIHSLSLKLGCLHSSPFLSNNLLHSYSLRPSYPSDPSYPSYPRNLFDEIPHPNVVAWSSIISCFARSPTPERAVSLLNRMRRTSPDVLPNKFTFCSAIAGCARLGDPLAAAQVHCATVKFGVDGDVYVIGALVDMYARCGRLDECRNVFDWAPERDVVTWTTMITSLANIGSSCSQIAAFGLFKDMLGRGVRPVDMTFASLFKVFDGPERLNQAKQTHGCMIKLGIELDDLLKSSLVAMYGRCGGIEEVVRLSSRIDTSAISWTSLLVAYINNGYNVDAIEVFQKMIEEKIAVDAFVIATILGACSALGEQRKGKEVHGFATRSCFLSDASVSNSLITLYGRCADIEKAERVFWLMDDRDIISWTAMLTCYGQNGQGEEALLFFQQMLRTGLNPPIFCVTGAIRACSTIAYHYIGIQLHAKTVRMGINLNLSVENSLVTMYAKCGNIEAASIIFLSMSERDIVSWNALITGFSCHGFEKEALGLFEQMKSAGICPDEVTFIGILVSCSRVGLVAEGSKYFRMMIEDYELEPQMEHYACVVDLFGRVGMLGKAMEFIDNMTCDPDYLIWETLLASCKVHGDIELGKFVAKKILEMRAKDASPYVTLSAIHASMDMWEKKARFRNMMRELGVHKEPGRSRIETHFRFRDA